MESLTPGPELENKIGPSRHFAALLNLVVIGSIADIEPAKLDL
jgi:hypothetical protein